MLTQEESYMAFCRGWQSAQKAIVKEIEDYSANWMANGPSKAAADAIKKKILALLTPRLAQEQDKVFGDE